MSSSYELDSIDRRILGALQVDGRMTYDELAVRVQLSASAVLRRVRRLEDEQVISRYVALVEPERVGLALTAYINYKGLPTFVKHHPAVVNRAAIDHGN